MGNVHTAGRMPAVERKAMLLTLVMTIFVITVQNSFDYEESMLREYADTSLLFHMQCYIDLYRMTTQ